MSSRKPSYTATPTVPPELMPRLAAIVEVLAGLKSVSQASRELKLSRNHFQTILHRALLAMVGAISLKRGGRPATPPPIATLKAQLKHLKRENSRLQARVGSTEQLLEVASGLLKGRIRPTSRQRRTRKNAGASSERQDDSDREAPRQHILRGVDQMHRLGLTFGRAAAIAGVNASTLRRWRARASAPTEITPRIHTAHRMTPELATRAGDVVRRLHGLIGAEALRHSVPGLSRRAAAWLKARTLSAMERERKASLVHVTVTQPGVVRGVDAMHFASTEGPLFALIAADSAVPYRTSLTTATRYDAALVARTLTTDFELHGAPLVLRLDRARAHDTPAVRAVLDAHAVIALHGPPRYPCFYGQLERQNREHRAWGAALPPLSRSQLEPCLSEMLEAVNALWPRRTLKWQTAAEAWKTRPPLSVDRLALREEVQDRAIYIAHRLKRRSHPQDLAERLAIEQTLEHMGYLRQEQGGWC